jgi:hypothetical protein
MRERAVIPGDGLAGRRQPPEIPAVHAPGGEAQRNGIAICHRGEEGVLEARKACQRFAVDPLQRL